MATKRMSDPGLEIPRFLPHSRTVIKPQWEAFAQARASGMSLTQAALTAGYVATSAPFQGPKLAQIPSVRDRIAEIVKERWQQEHMGADEILTRMARLARADVRDVMTDDGALLDPKSLTNQGAAAIAGIEIVEQWEGKGKARKKVGQVAKVKLRDPTPALRMLAEVAKLLKQPGEGMDALAGAIAERMASRRQARQVVEAEDATPAKPSRLA